MIYKIFTLPTLQHVRLVSVVWCCRINNALQDFLTLSSLELMTVLRCSYTHYLELRTLVSTIISPHPQTVRFNYV